MQIKITEKGNYNEESQPNPMRWMILYKEKDTSFSNESSWLRCKDFFNDYVYTYMTGDGFLIYGFNAGAMKINPGEPVFMLLDVMTSQWNDNIEKVNKWLETQDMPVISHAPWKESKHLIRLEPVYFKNTYNISLISLIIRLINIEHEFKSWNEILKYKEFPNSDQEKWNEVVKKNVFFNLPEKFDKYIWYEGEKYNSETIKENYYQLSSLVHNNGVISWSKYL